MVLEMKRALEDLKRGDTRGYRKIFDATYEEVYCRSLLLIQKEETVIEFMEGFFSELFGMLEEADETKDKENWFWQKYYQRVRKQYHKLLTEQDKTKSPAGVRTLAKLPASFPLLHRVMLVMYHRDDFTASEISGIFGLEEGKLQEELDKMEKLLPTLTKDQPEEVSGYVGSWKTLLLGASRQIISTCSDEWVDGLYARAAKEANIATAPSHEKKDSFEYFVADADLSEGKSKGSRTAEDDEEEEDDDEESEDDEYDDDDEEEEDDEEDDDDRYDWDLEDDGKRMILLGIVLALVIVAIVGFAAFKLLGNKNPKEQEAVSTEAEAENGDEGDASLVIRGDGPDENSEGSENSGESQENPEETEEAPEEPAPEEQPQESDATIMKVVPKSVNVRSEANTNCSVLTTVKSGEKVEVLGDLSQEWVQIRCIEQDSKEGYVKSELLASVE